MEACEPPRCPSFPRRFMELCPPLCSPEGLDVGRTGWPWVPQAQIAPFTARRQRTVNVLTVLWDQSWTVACKESRSPKATSLCPSPHSSAG